MLQSFVNKTDRMLNQTVKSSLRIVIFLMVRGQDKKRVQHVNKNQCHFERGTRRNLLRCPIIDSSVQKISPHPQY